MAEKCLKSALKRFEVLNEKKCKQTDDQKCKQTAEDLPPNEESKQTVDQPGGEGFFTPLPTPEPPKRSKQTADDDFEKIEVEAQVHTPNVQKIMKNIGKFGNTVVTKSRYYCIFLHQFFLKTF